MDTVTKTTRRLCFRAVGIQWLALITLLGLCLIATGVLSGLSSWNAKAWPGVLMSTVITLAGCFAIFVVFIALPLWVVYTFDKDLGLFRLERRKVFGKQIQEWRLQEIRSVAVAKLEDEGSTHHVIVVTFKAGEAVQLRDVTESPESEDYDAIVQQIGQFLGLSESPV